LIKLIYNTHRIHVISHTYDMRVRPRHLPLTYTLSVFTVFIRRSAPRPRYQLVVRAQPQIRVLASVASPIVQRGERFFFIKVSCSRFDRSGLLRWSTAVFLAVQVAPARDPWGWILAPALEPASARPLFRFHGSCAPTFISVAGLCISRTESVLVAGRSATFVVLFSADRSSLFSAWICTPWFGPELVAPVACSVVPSSVPGVSSQSV
jgi:hypothetical protein